MNKPKTRFPLKIIVSYLVLGALAVVVSYFLYTEYRTYIAASGAETETEKIIETGTLINEVYETDSFSRIALLTQKQEDFDQYLQKSNALYKKIDTLKSIITDSAQKVQLDSVKMLLQRKIQNIEQLRVLKLTSEQNTSLDDILREFKKFDRKTGRLSVEDIIREPSKLSYAKRKAWAKWADYFTETNVGFDTTQVNSITIDSLVKISRYIVLEAKRENSRTRNALKEKENELLQNELDISYRLREMIADFDAEMSRNRFVEDQQKIASEAKTKKVLRFAGVLGLGVIILFSYLILNDFFKTERLKRKLEREKQYSDEVLKTRDQLMATVSHDLKTPLNTIVGYSELFTHTPLSEKQQNYTQQIASSAHFISKMVDDLLDFSKLEAGKLPIDKVPFSLENLLHQIAKASKDLHIEKPIDLNLYIDETLEGKVFESDPLRIQQIVHNLVSNAYKFTEKGRIQITANVLSLKDDTYQVEIAVTDSGIGISKEKQQLIFKEFTQAESDTFQKFGGSGLGLAISKKIANLLEGTLKVESTLGEGSTFYFTLPLQTVAAQQAQSIVPQRIAALNGNLKAIIIDDDASMIKLLKELFEQMNIEVYGFTSFDSILKHPHLDFDFILTDIEMPNTSGFEVVEQLQSGVLESYTNQPIIAMTGARQHPRSKYLDSGFTDMLQKPFSKNQLIAALSPLFLNKIETHLPELKVFQNPSHALYDLSFLESFLNNPESVDEVLSIFYEQTEKDVKHIEQAIATFDCPLLANTAHRMLTMCRQLNAKKINPILETMEHCAKGETTQSEMESLFANLKVEVKKLTDALKNREKATA
ncbi:ATP-binding protein [Aureisphaera galaxeae]|uniref:hybrid sensor histidine kinase/response regulator n=1 Tax=Aureisphaera galaxeae TaxID=1538023 RepID=UPI00235058F3|nr:ATP-binding protein [Aureisphaera galaxeae]MDC8002753.1 ATP-binding protein [Aureisphaera galaxeae]